MKYARIMTLSIILIALFAVTFTGCDKRSLDLDQYEIISLTAPDTLYSGFETEIEALVLTKKGVPAPEQVVTFKTDRGVIEATATTNQFGIAKAKFYHNVTSSVVATIEASIQKSKMTAVVNIVPFDGDFGITHIIALPDSIYQDNNQTKSSIRAMVKDKEGVGVVGEIVKFKTTKGQITSLVQTDSSGVATATFGDNGEVGEALITAAIGESFKTVKVSIKPVLENYRITVRSQRDFIYNDNNITVSRITATVVDFDAYPVTEVPVRFRARRKGTNNPIGQIASLMITDSLGVATSIFRDNGDDPGVAEIQATFGDIHGTVDVEIRETPEVDEVKLVSLSQAYGLDQELTLRAEARDINGDFVADGTLITFDASLGNFEENIRTAETANGSASVRWNTGVQSGPVTFKAMVSHDVQDTQVRVINPGEPASINPRPFYENDEGEMVPIPIEGIPVNFMGKIEIRATVIDEFSNPVRDNLPIHFETTIGNIQPVAATNAEGVATANFYLGVSAGTALVKASYMPTADQEAAVGSTIFTIYSENIHSIAFATQQDIYLDVRGVGGIESRPLRVELFDYNGNLVSGQEQVKFELIAPIPTGTNINNIGPIDVVTANNGVATASIVSGLGSGTITVRASLVDQPVIQATKSNIVVRSGPPAVIQPSIGEFNTGTALGAGIWRIQAYAEVKDQYNNPVINGTAVHFSLMSADPADPSLPSDISVIGDGFVGNEGDEMPDGTPGTAFTHMTYHGRYINDQLYLKAASGEVEGMRLITLPIHGPSLEMVVVPMHVDFFANDPITANVNLDVIAHLNDGQGSPVSNSEIQLTSLYAKFIWIPGSINPQQDPSIIITRDGRARGRLNLRIWEIPEPTEDYFIQIDVLVVGYLLGTNTIAQAQFAGRRFIIPRPPGALSIIGE